VTVQTPPPAQACSATRVRPCQMPVGKYHFNDPRSERRRRLAVHEAGHAALAFRFNRYIRDVSISRNGGGATWIRIPRRSDSPSDADWRQRCAQTLLISLAGAAAEEKYCGRPEASPLDLEMASKYLLELRGDRTLLVNTAIETTRGILDQPRTWWAVRSIAAHLLKRGQLTGAQVGSICQRCGVPQH